VVDDESIKLIVAEIAPLLTGRAPGKIFQLGPASLAIDFGLRDAGYLFLSVEPAAPRLYLIKRRVRELEKQGCALKQFGLTLKKELEQTRMTSIKKDQGDRIVRLEFVGQDDLGESKTRILIAQLTGRSANLLLLDNQQRMIQSARSNQSMKVGEHYVPSSSPPPPREQASDLLVLIRSGTFARPSDAAHHYFIERFVVQDKQARIAAARSKLHKEISQQQRLLKQLEQDLNQHRDPDQQKRVGDLLLANLSTAKRTGDWVTLIDYFADGAATIEIEVDKAATLQEEAARRFALYAKSKRAIEQINARLQTVRSRLHELKSEQQLLEQKIAAGNLAALDSQPIGEKKRKAATSQPQRIPGTRRYASSDGFEILVGRAAHDNDHLTFKVAKPNDLWLHAADYGGSHVVVRNPTRKEIPHRTLIEAAQLAAYFSQAKKDPKVDVHYTERKFVSKIKAAKPGLVRLQRFKNITVQPKEAGSRI